MGFVYATAVLYRLYISIFTTYTLCVLYVSVCIMYDTLVILCLD